MFFNSFLSNNSSSINYLFINMIRLIIYNNNFPTNLKMNAKKFKLILTKSFDYRLLNDS